MAIGRQGMDASYSVKVSSRCMLRQLIDATQIFGYPHFSSASGNDVEARALVCGVCGANIGEG